MEKEEVFNLKQIIESIQQEFPNTPQDQLLSLAVKIRTNEILVEGLGLNNIGHHGGDLPPFLDQIHRSIVELENRVINIENNTDDLLKNSSL